MRRLVLGDLELHREPAGVVLERLGSRRVFALGLDELRWLMEQAGPQVFNDEEGKAS